MPRAAVTVLLNRPAGSSTDESRAAIEQAFNRAGVAAQIVVVPGSGLRGAAEKAAAAGDTLVAAGGDGTGSTGASVAAKASPTLRVIPLGALNHFAKNTRLPLAIPAALP